MCAYRLSYIDRLFDENIHMCFNGSLQYRGLPYISGKGIKLRFPPVFRIRFRIRMFLGLSDPHPDPLVISTDPDAGPAPDSSRFSLKC